MIGFPGLGIDGFTMNKNVFEIGNFKLAWYGAIIAAGFLLAVLYSLKRSKDFSLTQDEIIDMLMFAVPSAIVGARLYYVIWNWDVEFKNNFNQIYRIWDGGLAIYGGVIAAVIAAALFCWVRHIKIGAMLDVGALGLLIGQAIGRWGNFVNVEVYGLETTLPWRMRVFSGSSFADVHPLFLYESLWNIIGLVLLHFWSKKRRFNGQIMLAYITWYGIGRAVMEGMRDAEYILTIGSTTLAVSQLLAAISALAALLLLAYNFIFKQHEAVRINDWVLEREAWRESVAAAGSGEKTVEEAGDSDDSDNAEDDKNNGKADLDDYVEFDDAEEDEDDARSDAAEDSDYFEDDSNSVEEE